MCSSIEYIRYVFIGDHCFDTDNGKTDTRSDGCEYRSKYNCDSSYYSKNEATGFDANLMCCTCGGGTSKDIFNALLKP